jgi:hypothetical protein
MYVSGGEYAETEQLEAAVGADGSRPAQGPSPCRIAAALRETGKQFGLLKRRNSLTKCCPSDGQVEGVRPVTGRSHRTLLVTHVAS